MKLCIYGAGNTGKAFVQKEKEIMRQYSEVFFVDGNPALLNTMPDGITVRNLQSIDGDTEIIITSMEYWGEIYEICCLNQYQVIGIYDIYEEKIFSYKEMCRLKRSAYKNKEFIKYYQCKKEKMRIGLNHFLQTDDLFMNINEVAVMLSNLCNYASVHKQCPASRINEKEILPSEVFFKIIDELASVQFSGTICFHIYNEPLIDPRLFWFIEYVKRVLPHSMVEVYSNGYYLNNQMARELKNIGADILIVTAYGEKEHSRLIDLDVDLAYYVLFGNLDERLEHYKASEKAVSAEACRTYFTQVSIFSNGDIGTCCLDYLHAYDIGNVCKESLRDILNSERVITFQKELLKGNRSIYSVCKNCNWVSR